MKKITRKLFDGEIYALETTVPQNHEYYKIQDRMGEIEKHFTDKFSEEDEKYSAEWNDLRLMLADIHDFAFFDYGFSLGVRLACEAFVGEADNQRADEEWYPNKE